MNFFSLINNFFFFHNDAFTTTSVAELRYHLFVTRLEIETNFRKLFIDSMYFIDAFCYEKKRKTRIPPAPLHHRGVVSTRRGLLSISIIHPIVR